MRTLNPKQTKQLVELAGLAERIASGSATEKQVERALQLERGIPWPNMNIEQLARSSSALTRAEKQLDKVKVARKALQAKAGFRCYGCPRTFRTTQGLGLHFHHAKRNGGICR